MNFYYIDTLVKVEVALVDYTAFPHEAAAGGVDLGLGLFGFDFVVGRFVEVVVQQQVAQPVVYIPLQGIVWRLVQLFKSLMVEDYGRIGYMTFFHLHALPIEFLGLFGVVLVA